MCCYVPKKCIVVSENMRQIQFYSHSTVSSAPPSHWRNPFAFQTHTEWERWAIIDFNWWVDDDTHTHKHSSLKRERSNLLMILMKYLIWTKPKDRSRDIMHEGKTRFSNLYQHFNKLFSDVDGNCIRKQSYWIRWEPAFELIPFSMSIQ